MVLIGFDVQVSRLPRTVDNENQPQLAESGPDGMIASLPHMLYTEAGHIKVYYVPSQTLHQM